MFESTKGDADYEDNTDERMTVMSTITSTYNTAYTTIDHNTAFEKDWRSIGEMSIDIRNTEGPSDGVALKNSTYLQPNA